MKYLTVQYSPNTENITLHHLSSTVPQFKDKLPPPTPIWNTYFVNTIKLGFIILGIQNPSPIVHKTHLFKNAKK